MLQTNTKHRRSFFNAKTISSSISFCSGEPGITGPQGVPGERGIKGDPGQQGKGEEKGTRVPAKFASYRKIVHGHKEIVDFKANYII